MRVASDDMDSARKEFSKKKRAFDVVAKARWVWSDKYRAIVRKGAVLHVPVKAGIWRTTFFLMPEAAKKPPLHS